MATTSITVTETPLVRLLLSRADDALVLGHRLSEWTGRAPVLEEELALANIALDLIGQARSLYALAGEAEGAGHDEDQFAYLRDQNQYRNLLLLEQPNGDFAVTIARLTLYAVFIDAWWRAAARSADPRIAGIAAKAEKETAYHVRHAGEWLIRLGDGTPESHARAQAAIDQLWPFTGEMFEPETSGFAPDPATFHPSWSREIGAFLARATLIRPEDGWMQTGGRRGRHTEHLGHMLTDLQYLQRSFPGATW